MRYGSTILVVASAFLGAGPVAAQTGAGDESPTAENPLRPQECDAPEYRQFDFWVGEWDVTGPDGKPAGTNRITRILKDCVLLEEWTGAGGTGGKSFNIWSRADRKWHQTWVSDTGTVLQLEGALKDGAMVMEGVSMTADGSTVRNRITWSVIDGDGDRVRQHWEQSRDNGRTWTTAFDGTYTRARAEGGSSS